MYSKIGTQSCGSVKIAQYSILFCVLTVISAISVQMTGMLTVTMIYKNYTSHKEDALDIFTH